MCGLHDADATVHSACEQALWLLWSKSGDAAVEAEMELGMTLLSATVGPRRREALADALGVFERLCLSAPWFAEAQNKRVRSRLPQRPALAD